MGIRAQINWVTALSLIFHISGALFLSFRRASGILGPLLYVADEVSYAFTIVIGVITWEYGALLAHLNFVARARTR